MMLDDKRNKWHQHRRKREDGTRRSGGDESKKVFVGGLGPGTSAKTLRSYFGQFGTIVARAGSGLWNSRTTFPTECWMLTTPSSSVAAACARTRTAMCRACRSFAEPLVDSRSYARVIFLGQAA